MGVKLLQIKLACANSLEHVFDAVSVVYCFSLCFQESGQIPPQVEAASKQADETLASAKDAQPGSPQAAAAAAKADTVGSEDHGDDKKSSQGKKRKAANEPSKCSNLM